MENKHLQTIRKNLFLPGKNNCNKMLRATVIDTVFHRILDLKRGWISILASFFLYLPQNIQADRDKLLPK